MADGATDLLLLLQCCARRACSGCLLALVCMLRSAWPLVRYLPWLQWQHPAIVFID